MSDDVKPVEPVQEPAAEANDGQATSPLTGKATEQATAHAGEPAGKQGASPYDARGTAPAAGKQGRPWVLRTLFNLLVLAALGLLGWLTWQQQTALQSLEAVLEGQAQQEQTLEARLDSINAARQALESLQQEQAATLLQQQEALAAQLDQQQQQQADQLSSLNAELARVRLQGQAAGGSAATVQLDEVAALLRLARERLLGAQDLETAISLYLAGDEILRSFDDPAVQQVRQSLSRELASLRAVQLPDLAAIHAEVGRIQQAAAMLVIASEFSGDAPRFSGAAASADAETSGWLSSLANTLGQHFVITQRDAPVLPRLTDEGVMLIRLGIDLQLEQARLALLLGEHGLYQSALQTAASSIESYLEGPGKADVLSSLDRVRGQSIRAELPPVGATLNALGQLLANPARGEQR